MSRNTTALVSNPSWRSFSVTRHPMLSLTTSAFNERALKLYEKLGFRHEGRGREHILLDGTRWDIVYMGILRDEFLD